MLRKLLFIGCFLSIQIAFSQIWKNPLSLKKTWKTSDTIQIDERTLLPNQPKIDSLKDYRFDLEKSTLYLNNKPKDSVIVLKYYTYPYKLNKAYYYREKSSILKSRPKLFNSVYIGEKTSIDKTIRALNAEGSIVRGVSLGNNQSSSLNSVLDLKINGQLAPNLFIRAAISDANIPIQTQAYTQQLQEFDQLFIEIYNDKFSLKAGNIELNQSEDYFNNFTRKISGVKATVNIPVKNGNLSLEASGAMPRAQYNKVEIKAIDANKGPYFLGNTAQNRVVIISGSEKVFLDGILLKSGSQNDYLIDYNLGELTFTNQRMISAESRIIVEYEYSNNAYSKYLFYNGLKYKSKKLSISSHFYSDADNKNNSLSQSLSEQQKQILSEAGNNIEWMKSPSEVLTPFDENKVLYRKINQDETFYFERSIDSNEELYSVKFSFVGENKGNYRESNFELNGKVFEYIPPINGVKQGNYSSIIPLEAPKKLQILSVNSNLKLNEKSSIGLDVAWSKYDQNLFSSIDNNQNNGLALRLNHQQNFKIKKWDINSLLAYHFIQDKFKTSERLENIEFNRDFNLDFDISKNTRSMFSGKIVAKKDSVMLVSYKIDHLDNKLSYKGFKQRLKMDYNDKDVYFKSDNSVLKSKNNLNKSGYLRSLQKVDKFWNKSWIGASVRYDNLKEDEKEGQLNRSNAISKYLAYFAVGDSLKSYAKIGAYHTKIDSSYQGNLRRFSKANNLFFKSQIKESKNTKLQLNLNYRLIDYLAMDEKESYVNGQLIYHQNLMKKAIQYQLLYEIGSGLEPQRDYTYIKVSDGQGIYTWIDYNGNKIQELNEFEIAKFEDQAQYIRVFTNNTAYLRSNFNKINQSLRIIPRLWFREKNIWSKFEAKLSYQITQKSDKLKNEIQWSPYQNNSIIRKDERLKMTLYFNKIKHKFSGKYSYKNTSNHFRLVTENERSNLKEHRLFTYFNPSVFWRISLENFNYLKTKNSESFSNQNYEIKSLGFYPKASYKLSKNIQLEAYYKYQEKENKRGEELLYTNLLGIDSQFNIKKSGRLSLSFKYVNQNFKGNSYSTTAYQMLEGIKTGENFIWETSWQHKINEYLDLSLHYLGRKSEGNTAIHNGNVQLKASF